MRRSMPIATILNKSATPPSRRCRGRSPHPEAPMSEQIAFRMNLNPGQAHEYRKRHDEIFPELSKALKDAGVSDYSIWLDAEANHLFGILTRTDNHTMDR